MKHSYCWYWKLFIKEDTNNMGVRQGCCLSFTLFGLYIDNLTRNWKGKVTSYFWIFFCILIIQEHEDDLVPYILLLSLHLNTSSKYQSLKTMLWLLQDKNSVENNDKLYNNWSKVPICNIWDISQCQWYILNNKTTKFNSVRDLTYENKKRESGGFI